MTQPDKICEAVKAKNGAWSMHLRAEDGTARAAHSIYEPEAEATAMAGALEFGGEGLLAVLGAGMGHHIRALMARFPSAEIVVIEPLREIYDTAVECGALPEGLRYVVGAAAADALREIASLQAGRGIKPLGLFVLTAEASAFPSQFNPLIEPLRRTVSVRLWERLRYAKFQGGRVSVLVFDSDYFLVREIVNALTRLGHEVRRIAVGKDVRPDAMIEALIGGIVVFRPDFVLTVNHLGFDEQGVLTEFLRSIEMPAASWFVDSPRIIVGDHKGNVSPYMVMFSWEKTYTARIRAMGFEHAYYLPLGTDETVFKPIKPSAKQRKRYGGAVGFVGDSMVRPAAKKLGELPERLRPMVEAVSVLFARSPRYVSMDAIMREAAPDALALEGPERTAFEAAVTWRATLLYRLACVRKLDGGLVIYGDVEGWRTLGPGAEIRPPVSYHDTLPLLYNSCAVNFNATSLQMPSAVNQRVFDVPACGAFLMTDHQGALDELFEAGREVVTYGSADEIPEMLSYYRDRPERRGEIARLGRERVLKEHTYLHRLAELTAWMRRAFA